MQAVLISTYELGRQPFGLASPAAWLRREGWNVRCVDGAKQRLDDSCLQTADLIGIHLPMHTATRLAGPVIERARGMNRAARICAYGLYAPLNEPWLRSIGVDEVLGGEFEADLASIARELGASVGVLSPSPVAAATPTRSGRSHGGSPVQRLDFLVPDRSDLPPLSRYATLHMPDGSRKVVGSTEASRGCKHLCRHCPIVPVYNGQFRVVQRAVVMADIDAQVAAGADHITFGDPDFFNGPTHAMRVVEEMHAAHPETTFDVTIKIEHLLEHRRLLPRLAAAGCAFVTSAVESVDDRVLERLDKGHTRADFVEAVAVCSTGGITLVPTFVAFHPWLTLADYCDLLDTIAELRLIDNVAPIQLGIRLLVTAGSRLLDLPELRAHLEPFDPGTLSYPWRHSDPAVDALHRDVMAIITGSVKSNRRAIFHQIRRLAHERAERPQPDPPAAGIRAVPYLDEPWYCCAEPNPDDIRLV